jgi:hypothetical protein
MKKLILFIGGLALVYSLLYADVPPATVKNAFDKKFAHAKNVIWNKEPTKGWAVEFNGRGGHKIHVSYTTEGIWLVTEKEINISSLPKAVSKAIHWKYPDWTIILAQNNESSKAGIIYEASLVKGLEKKDVSFDANGLPINEE